MENPTSSNPPKGIQPPGIGGNEPTDSPLGNNPKPATSEPEENPTSSEKNKSMDIKPGTPRIGLVIAGIIVVLAGIIGGMYYWMKPASPAAASASADNGKAPVVTPVVAAPVASSAASAAATPPSATTPPASVALTAPAAAKPPQKSLYDAALATPEDFRDNDLCGPLARKKTFFVGTETGDENPLIGFICPQSGNEFESLPTSKARIIGGNLIVANGLSIESLFGNSMSHVGTNNKNGAQTAKNAHPMSDYMTGKTHILVRNGTSVIDLLNPLVVQVGENGGDTFDQICQPYKAMSKAPDSKVEDEIWSRCRREKTVGNVAKTIKLLKEVQVHPTVTREQFRITVAQVQTLEEKVVKSENPVVVHPPQRVPTDVGK